MYNENIEIGEKIKKFRKSKGFTQKELAAKIGKAESSVQKYEKGLVTIPLEVLGKIAAALDITAYELCSNYEKYSFTGILEKREKTNKCLFNLLRSMGYVITEREIKFLYGDSNIDILTTIKEGDVDDVATSNNAVTLRQKDLSKFIEDIKDYINYKFWQCRKSGFVSYDSFEEMERAIETVERDKKGAD